MLVDAVTRQPWTGMESGSEYPFGYYQHSYIIVCDYAGCDALMPDPDHLWPDPYLRVMLESGFTREPSEWHTEIFHNFCPEHIASPCLGVTLHEGHSPLWTCDQCPWHWMGLVLDDPDKWQYDGRKDASERADWHIKAAGDRVRWREAQVLAWHRKEKFPQQKDFDFAREIEVWPPDSYTRELETHDVACWRCGDQITVEDRYQHTSMPDGWHALVDRHSGVQWLCPEDSKRALQKADVQKDAPGGVVQLCGRFS